MSPLPRKVATHNQSTRISISVATLNRPKGLSALLEALSALNLPENLEARVVIVDNSEDANQRANVEERVKTFPHDLNYFHEPVKGITFARNRGLREALDNGSSYIAFIDDDEIPRADWLSKLYMEISQTDASVVSGAVIPKFEEPPSWWMIAGDFFSVTGIPELTPFPYGHTSNSIVDLAPVRQLGLSFSPKLALAGGEDTYFFTQLREAGFQTFFTEKATIQEIIVPERATLNWLVSRWFRTGNTDGIIKHLLAPNHITSVKNFTGGGFRVVIGSLQAVAGLPLLLTSNTASFKGLKTLCRGLGFISSSLGVTYQEYKNHNR